MTVTCLLSRWKSNQYIATQHQTQATLGGTLQDSSSKMCSEKPQALMHSRFTEGLPSNRASQHRDHSTITGQDLVTDLESHGMNLLKPSFLYTGLFFVVS
jgi:hypothetical protein